MGPLYDTHFRGKGAVTALLLVCTAGLRSHNIGGGGRIWKMFRSLVVMGGERGPTWSKFRGKHVNEKVGGQLIAKEVAARGVAPSRTLDCILP